MTWDVANTTAAPVSCANVNIDLSTDGGLTFPTSLAAGTPNDGTESVTIPNVTTSTARVKVACANNIFFDISNANFAIGASIGPVVATGAASAITRDGRDAQRHGEQQRREPRPSRSSTASPRATAAPSPRRRARSRPARPARPCPRRSAG